MKALADENFPRAAVEALRRRGWDVACVQERAPGIVDAKVAALARAEGRILLTFDKDFGKIWRRDPNESSAIVLFRLPHLSTAETTNRIVQVLTSGADWTEGFWVVDRER